MKAGMMKGFFISGTLHLVLLLMVFTIVRSEVSRPKVDISFLFRETQEDTYSDPSGITPEPYSPFKEGVDSLLPPLEKGGKGGFDQGLSGESPVPMQGAKERGNNIPAETGTQSSNEDMDSRSGGNEASFVPSDLQIASTGSSDGTLMSLGLTKDDENTLPFKGRAGRGWDSRGETHPHLNPLPEGEEIGTGEFSGETAVGGSTEEIAIMAVNDSEGETVEATGGSLPEGYGTTEQGAGDSVYGGLSERGTPLPSESGSGNSGISIEGFMSHLESMKWYPYLARRKSIEGTVLLKLRLDKHGELIGVDIKESSGHTILDHAAVSLLKKACPFRHGMGKDIAIEVPVTYALVR